MLDYTYRTTLYHTVTRCNMLHHISTQCNVLESLSSPLFPKTHFRSFCCLFREGTAREKSECKCWYKACSADPTTQVGAGIVRTTPAKFNTEAVMVNGVCSVTPTRAN